MDNVMSIHSLNPATLDAHAALYIQCMKGESPLSRAERGAEAAGALVDALMAGDPSELSERERAMVRFATKLTQTPSEMREDTTARQPPLPSRNAFGDSALNRFVSRADGRRCFAGSGPGRPIDPRPRPGDGVLRLRQPPRRGAGRALWRRRGRAWAVASAALAQQHGKSSSTVTSRARVAASPLLPPPTGWRGLGAGSGHGNRVRSRALRGCWRVPKANKSICNPSNGSLRLLALRRQPQRVTLQHHAK